MKLNVGNNGTEALIVKADQLLEWSSAVYEVSRRFTEAGYPGLILTAIVLRDEGDPANDLVCLCVDDPVGLSASQQQSLLLHAAGRAVELRQDRPGSVIMD